MNQDLYTLDALSSWPLWVDDDDDHALSVTKLTASKHRSLSKMNAVTLSVGRLEGHQTCKLLHVGLLVVTT